MHRLVYLSQLTRRLSAQEARSMIDLSRRNNARDAVTGVLLLQGRCIFQVLEGTEEAVMRRFHKIREDTRHTHLRIVQSDTVGGRIFDGWSMGVLMPQHMPTIERNCLFSLFELFPATGQPRGDEAQVLRLLRTLFSGFELEMAA